jgi:hypothetical protein
MGVVLTIWFDAAVANIIFCNVRKPTVVAMHGEENAYLPVQKNHQTCRPKFPQQHLGKLKPNVFAGRFG